MHTYVCALGVSSGMCTYLWVCTGGVLVDVHIAMSVRWGCQIGCVHRYRCMLRGTRWVCT